MMVPAWPKVRIEQIGKDFGDAPFGTNLKSKDYVACGVPVIQGRNIKDNKFQWNHKLYVSEEKFQSLKRSHCHEGDLVFPKVGTIGVAALMPKVEGRTTFLLSTNMMKMSVDPTRADLGYIYYYFTQDSVRESIRASAGGSSQPIFNFTALKRFEVPLPPLSIQREIARVLSAFDELIENNQRRINILERMARSIYREWFVNFRAPGYEDRPRIVSALGEVPKGWEVVRFTELADVLSGGTPKTDVAEYWNGEIPFFTPRDAPSCFYVYDTDKHVTELGLTKCASELYPTDTVFITARGTVGKVALPSVPMAMNQSCYALRGKADVPQHYLFLLTLQQVEYLKTNTGGATFNTIVVDTFRGMRVLNPPRELVTRFAHQVSATFAQINTLQRQIQSLRRTRDLLLPRLLSGQIDVEVAATAA